MTDRAKIAFVYGAVLLGVCLWLAAIIAAPALKAAGSGLAPFVYACFSPVCHQIPARSFLLWGYPTAVCARCLAIYLGFLAGLAAYPWIRGFRTVRLPKTTTLILFSLPIGLDTGANFVRLWSTPNPVRFAVGLLWGTILPFYFITGVSELVLFFTRKQTSR